MPPQMQRLRYVHARICCHTRPRLARASLRGSARQRHRERKTAPHHHFPRQQPRSASSDAQRRCRTLPEQTPLHPYTHMGISQVLPNQTYKGLCTRTAQCLRTTAQAHHGTGAPRHRRTTKAPRATAGFVCVNEKEAPLGFTPRPEAAMPSTCPPRLLSCHAGAPVHTYRKRLCENGQRQAAVDQHYLEIYQCIKPPGKGKECKGGRRQCAESAERCSTSHMPYIQRKHTTGTRQGLIQHSISTQGTPHPCNTTCTAQTCPKLQRNGPPISSGSHLPTFPSNPRSFTRV